MRSAMQCEANFNAAIVQSFWNFTLKIHTLKMRARFWSSLHGRHSMSAFNSLSVTLHSVWGAFNKFRTLSVSSLIQSFISPTYRFDHFTHTTDRPETMYWIAILYLPISLSCQPMCTTLPITSRMLEWTFSQIDFTLHKSYWNILCLPAYSVALFLFLFLFLIQSVRLIDEEKNGINQITQTQTSHTYCKSLFLGFHPILYRLHTTNCMCIL